MEHKPDLIGWCLDDLGVVGVRVKINDTTKREHVDGEKKGAQH